MLKYTFMSEALQLQGCLENHKGIYSCPGQFIVAKIASGKAKKMYSKNKRVIVLLRVRVNSVYS